MFAAEAARSRLGTTGVPKTTCVLGKAQSRPLLTLETEMEGTQTTDTLQWRMTNRRRMSNRCRAVWAAQLGCSPFASG